MAFFRGDTNGVGAHDHLAEKIALEGKKWAAEHWRMSDMQVCKSSLPVFGDYESHMSFARADLYRLLLEYARIMHRSDRDSSSMDM